MTARGHYAFLIVHAAMWGVLVEAAFAARPHSLWTWLFAGPLAISGGCASALAAGLPEEPLDLPLIDALDLRPRWEAHPYFDKYRRGERDWKGGLELAASGWHTIRLAPKVGRVDMTFTVQ